MTRTLAVLLGLALVAAAPANARTVAAVPVAPHDLTLTAADGVKVFATEYRPVRARATILLFHQAGSGAGEYATIAPKLAAAGYDALAIDQRSGGTLYGENRTVKALGRSTDYPAALADLQAAVGWARTQKRPIIVWGSSYSSSLVFPLAAKNRDVKALLAFSPGEYFADKTMVARAAAMLTIPVYVTSASKPEEIASARTIASAVPGHRATQFVPKIGVHGSSTLIAAKDPAGAAQNWAAVMAFLHRVAP